MSDSFKMSVWIIFIPALLFLFSYGNLFMMFLSLEAFLMIIYFLFSYSHITNMSFLLIFVCLFIMEGVYGLSIIVKFSRSYGGNYFLMW